MRIQVTGEVVATATQELAQRRRVPWGRWLVWELLVAFLGLLGFGAYRAQAGQVSHGPAPDFTLELSCSTAEPSAFRTNAAKW